MHIKSTRFKQDMILRMHYFVYRLIYQKIPLTNAERAEYFGQVRTQGVLQRGDQSGEIHDASLVDDLNEAGREYTSLPRSGARIA